jgi:hypothetical protein
MSNTTLRDHLTAIINSAVSRAVDEALAAYKHVLSASIDGGGATTKVDKSAPASGPPKKRRKGARRDPKAIEITVAAVLAFVEQSPGLRAEQIAKGVGGDKGDISDALARLRAAKKVKTKGHKRSMTYSI